jgi:hypothetical protein
MPLFVASFSGLGTDNNYRKGLKTIMVWFSKPAYRIELIMCAELGIKYMHD